MKNILLSVLIFLVGFSSFAQKDKSKNKKDKFENPYEISVLGVDNQPGISLTAVVYQNPEENYFELIVNDEQTTLSYEANLYDMTGNLLKHNFIVEVYTIIPVNILTNGIYYLKIINSGEVLKIFQIVKK
jgi:hypothetical protein